MRVCVCVHVYKKPVCVCIHIHFRGIYGWCVGVCGCVWVCGCVYIYCIYISGVSMGVCGVMCVCWCLWVFGCVYTFFVYKYQGCP
jgi:hypothetical protein